MLRTTLIRTFEWKDVFSVQQGCDPPAKSTLSKLVDICAIMKMTESGEAEKVYKYFLPLINASILFNILSICQAICVFTFDTLEIGG